MHSYTFERSHKRQKVTYTISLNALQMIAGKTFLDYINLSSPNDYKKNDKMIYKYFKDKYYKRKHKP